MTRLDQPSLDLEDTYSLLIAGCDARGWNAVPLKVYWSANSTTLIPTNSAVYGLSQSCRNVVFLNKARRDSKWVFDLIRSDDATGVALLDATLDGINRAIAERDYEYLDSVLDKTPTQTASRHLLLALARSTFVVKEKLSNWRPFVMRIARDFERRGLQPDTLLNGLL